MEEKEDKFSKYRKAAGVDRPATWPGWAAAAVLLALTVGAWMHAIPVYFPSTGKSAFSAKAGMPGVTAVNSWKRPGELAVVFFDIGQGDAAFIQTPRGKNILIDSGEGKTPDVRFIRPVDAANRVILPFLQQIGVKHLDIVIATHPHSDHMGSMADVLGSRNLTIGEVWISGFVHLTSSNKSVLAVVKRRKIPLYTPDPNQIPIRMDFGSEIAAYILFVDPNADSPNNSSIVLKLTYGHVNFLFTGDAEEPVEKKIAVRWGHELKSQVLKVGHHGSKTSSLQIFLNQVRPEASVISVGAYNTFGHPRPEVVKRLEEIGSKVYRTDEQGSIFVFSDGKTFRVEPSRL